MAWNDLGLMGILLVSFRMAELRGGKEYESLQLYRDRKVSSCLSLENPSELVRKVDIQDA